MYKPDEDIIDELEPDSESSFNVDELDLDKLIQDESENLKEPVVENMSPFMSRLQWWGFTILLLFLIGIILRMLFGPPWIDRFRHVRYPIAIDAGNGLVGVIVPKFIDKESLKCYLVIVDYDGKVHKTDDLGRYYSGPIDLAMGESRYYFISGDGSWVAGRKYVQSGTAGNYDFDLAQFGWKLRNGIDILAGSDGKEYLNVFNDNELITLNYHDGIWEKGHGYSSKDWGYKDFYIIDFDGYYATGQVGGEIVLIEFPNYIDGFDRPMNETRLTMIPARPRYPLEFVYKPVKVISADRLTRSIDCVVLKNDRIFNLPYKYMDDQVFIKFTDKVDFDVLAHDYFSKKDIRGIVFMTYYESTKDKPDFVIAYLHNNEFRLAALQHERPKPLWDLSLTSIIESEWRFRTFNF